MTENYSSALRSAKRYLPPVVVEFLRRLFPRRVPYRLQFVRGDWSDLSKELDTLGWDSSLISEKEAAKWEQFCKLLDGLGPLGFSHEAPSLDQRDSISFHNLHMTYAYVVARASLGRTGLSILDFGGSLGHYYQVARSLFPGLELDFSCKELPSLVGVGRALNPQVVWYDDDRYLQRLYDLAMITSSLQCMEDWRTTLRDVCRCARSFFFLSRVPVVEEGEGFIAIQHAYGTRMLHRQFSREELLHAVFAEGFALEREFIVGDHLRFDGTDRRAELRSWLFERRS